jgi:hypothetical protein
MYVCGDRFSISSGTTKKKSQLFTIKDFYHRFWYPSKPTDNIFAVRSIRSFVSTASQTKNFVR